MARFDEDRWEEVSHNVYRRRTAAKAGPSPDATEAALSLAAENGLDITEVVGTGSGGRITKWDVEAYLENDEY